MHDSTLPSAGEPLAAKRDAAGQNILHIRRLGIDTYQEPVVFLREDSHVCKSEGFEALSRVEIQLGDRHIVATVNVVRADGAIALAREQAGLSEAAWRALGGTADDRVRISHAAPVESFSQVRAKIFGHAFGADALHSIMADIVAGHYSNIEMAAFITTCASNHFDVRETIALTRAMVEVGSRLAWQTPMVMDKHCVGGIPGNRTTLIVVPIVAALGATIPKTSSRAITSPSGSADTMETLAPVALDVQSMRRVVEREGGCIVWGGAVNLSPADDILIRVERPLDLDSDTQLVASVISKKVAAGSTHVVIDVPVGPTAKVRSDAAGNVLAARLAEVGGALGLKVEVVLTDGTQPVGRGIGPGLEARDVLAVLRNDADAPRDLRERSLLVAGRVLEMAGLASARNGQALAQATLDDGRAWKKFQAIAEAQGGMREPRLARHRQTIGAGRSGIVTAVDNRRLSRIAKLAGAPRAAPAGLDLHVRAGMAVATGQPLYTVHADSAGELAYALDYAGRQQDVIAVFEA